MLMTRLRNMVSPAQDDDSFSEEEQDQDEHISEQGSESRMGVER